MTGAPAVDPRGIQAAYEVIRPHLRVTPVLELDPADFGLAAGRLVLKLEQLQHAGTFKTRGAFANLLLRRLPPAGVVAASGGNHGVAVAYAAMRLGVRAKVFVPTVSSPAKIQRIRDYGADLVVDGERYADALAASEAWAAREGAASVHAFDGLETLLGQGTLGLELARQAPDLDTLLVSVGGGGLIGGLAAWYAGAVRVVGVEPEAAPTLFRALEAGRPVDAEAAGFAPRARYNTAEPWRPCMSEVNLTAAFSTVPAGDQEAFKRVIVETVEQLAREEGSFKRAKLVFTESDERCALTAELDGVKREG